MDLNAFKNLTVEQRTDWLRKQGERISAEESREANKMGLPSVSADPKKQSFTVNENLGIRGKGAQSFKASASTKLEVGSTVEMNQAIQNFVNGIGEQGVWSCRFTRQVTEHGKSVWTGACYNTKSVIMSHMKVDPVHGTPRPHTFDRSGLDQ
ncbi:MAG: hypothetical protein M1820_005990 [Bogoriella megaspora]|nr:MAG: hypothetical protein M1820_005990 [Bogoriella megaspora]